MDECTSGGRRSERESVCVMVCVRGEGGGRGSKRKKEREREMSKHLKQNNPRIAQILSTDDQTRTTLKDQSKISQNFRKNICQQKIK